MFNTKTVRRPIGRKMTFEILGVMICLVSIVSLLSLKIPLAAFVTVLLASYAVNNTAADTTAPSDEEIRLFVRDENQKPVAGAKVIVQMLHNPSLAYNSETITRIVTLAEFRLTSNADGSYQFPVTKEQASDPDLILLVNAAHPDYISCGFLYEKLSTFRESFKLPDNTAHVTIPLTRSAKVSAAVLTPTGKPAASVLVFASSEDESGNTVQTEIRTDKDGKFVIGTLPGKERLLWILPNDAAPFYAALKENDAELGTLRLQNGVVLKGRAVDVDGKAVSNVRLSLLLKDSTAVRRHGHDAACRDAITDSEGRFQFRPLNPGLYVLNYGVLMEYERYGDELAPEAAYVNLCNSELWTGKTAPKQELPAENSTVKFVNQDITLTEQVVQEVECRGLKTFDLTILVTNDFTKNHNNLSLLVHGEFQGKNWWDSTKFSETVSTLKVPVGLKNCRIELVDGNVIRYFPFRFRLPNQEKWSNNWYAILGDLDSQSTLSIDVAPYEPAEVKVACLEPDGKPMPQNTFQVKYINVEFQDPITVTDNGVEICTMIDRHQLGVEFGILDNAAVMWRYRPILADEEFTLSAVGFDETRRYKPVTETLKLKSGERRELKLLLRERDEKK
ncbi:MAG: carboxypeptidase-like regulatory domain-containing protein [Planctomycetaceae bacterium]|jgi:uncharacterized GH25 family protein|nr:carboxypeptidase-like regulatory domain-containing protein [Planctomycetaceae bacterium]